MQPFVKLWKIICFSLCTCAVKKYFMKYLLFLYSDFLDIAFYFRFSSCLIVALHLTENPTCYNQTSENKFKFFFKEFKTIWLILALFFHKTTQMLRKTYKLMFSIYRIFGTTYITGWCRTLCFFSTICYWFF